MGKTRATKGSKQAKQKGKRESGVQAPSKRNRATSRRTDRADASHQSGQTQDRAQHGKQRRTPNDPVTVLFVGDNSFAEFQPMLERLAPHAVLAFAKKNDAVARLRTWSPEIVICAESRPGEFEGEFLQSLQAAAPVSRLMSVTASLCQGDRRGKPFAGAWRLAWNQAPLRLAVGMNQRRIGRAAWWSEWPESGSHNPQNQAVCAGGVAVEGDHRAAIIASNDHDFAMVLGDSVREFDLVPVMVQSADVSGTLAASKIHGTRLVICDVRRLDELEPAGISGGTQHFRKAFGQTPLIIVSGDLTIDEFHACAASSVTAALKKPLELDDLRQSIADLLTESDATKKRGQAAAAAG